jgi:hypothetical protein
MDPKGDIFCSNERRKISICRPKIASASSLSANHVFLMSNKNASVKRIFLVVPAYHGCVTATAASDDLSLAKIGTRGAPGQTRGSRRPRGSWGASWPFHALARRPLKVSYGIQNILCVSWFLLGSVFLVLNWCNKVKDAVQMIAQVRDPNHYCRIRVQSFF